MSKSEILMDIVTSLRSLATSIEAAAATMLIEAGPVSSALTGKSESAVQKVIKLEDVRSVLAEKSMAGFTAEIRGLLEKYGAPKLSQIDPANYYALLAEAEALK